MNVRPDLPMDKDQFFRWLECQDSRYELVDGRVVMLPFVTRNHARICYNLTTSLGRRLDEARYGVTIGDFAVETGGHSLRYADIMVEPFNTEGGGRSTMNALLLVEVLSSSTMHVDFGQKREEYLALPSLGTYLICAQDEARIWNWTRVDGRWPDQPEIVEALGGIVTVPALGVDLPLTELYRNLSLR